MMSKANVSFEAQPSSWVEAGERLDELESASGQEPLVGPRKSLDRSTARDEALTKL